MLIQAREIVEARGMVQDVQEALGVHPFVAGKVYQLLVISQRSTQLYSILPTLQTR